MEKRRFTILSNTPVAAGAYRLELRDFSTPPAAPLEMTNNRSFRPDEAPLSFRPSEARGEICQGEFIHIALPGFYLRRPLSVCDCGPDSLTVIYKVVGEGTRTLSEMPVGTVLDVLTGLGRGFDPSACRSEALLIGGGLGVPPLYLLAKRLKAQGKEVTAVLGFNKAKEMMLVQEFMYVCDSVIVSTADGSYGLKGFVTDVIKALHPSYDFFYTCGPIVMMKAVCQLLDGPGEVSLEERMGCGAGFCYGCSIETKNGPKRVCKDGPVFRKEELLW